MAKMDSSIILDRRPSRCWRHATGCSSGRSRYMRPGAGARLRCGHAHRCLGLRMRALRDADRRPCFPGANATDVLATITTRSPIGRSFQQTRPTDTRRVRMLPVQDRERRLDDDGTGALRSSERSPERRKRQPRPDVLYPRFPISESDSADWWPSLAGAAAIALGAKGSTCDPAATRRLGLGDRARLVGRTLTRRAAPCLCGSPRVTPET